MGREHVEFIQSQQLPWAPAPWAHFAGADCKLLSRDAASGAATALVRLDPGWRRDEVEISRDPPLAATVPAALRHVTRSSGWQPPSF